MIKTNYKGFTLLELLIVVIIVTVLAAVAWPQYKHAMLKSRFSKVMPVAKAVADANEVFYLGSNYYANNTEKDMLDVSAAPDTMVELPTQEQEEQYNYVATSRSDAPGARYIMYQKNSPMFAGTIQCEADESNEDALWLCEKGLNSTQEISGSVNLAEGNYRTFLLSGVVGTTDKLPTSLAKLAASLCAGKTDCTASVEGNTVTSQECSGNAEGGTRTCISRTYDDKGEQVDYEKTKETCGTWSIIGGMSNPRACTKTTYDENNQQTGSFKEACDLDKATWENGVCTWTSGSQNWYMYDETIGNNRRYYYYACAYADCRSERREYNELEGGVYTLTGQVDYETLNGEKVVYAPYTYWNLPTQNLKTTVSQTPPTTYLDPTGNVTFTTTNTQTSEVTNTVTCAYSNADWERGTCKPGTAIE